MSDRVLVLREYESARIGERWDAAERIVTPRAANAIERLQAGAREPLFEVGRRHVRALNHVGTVCVDGHAIDVLPKIDRSDDRTRANLLAMLQVAGLVPTLPAGVGAQADADLSFMEIILRLYIERLTDEWRRGHVAGFRRVERNRPHLRGKLRVAEQLRVNLHAPWRLHTAADEHIEDVAVSRLLKAALRACYRHAATDRTRRGALQLAAEFDDVSDVAFTAEQCERIGTDRQSARFAALVELAKLIVAHQSPDRSGDRDTYALLFDMNVVFERCIGNLLKRHACPPGMAVRLQVGGRALLRQGATGRFWLRPDIGVFRDGDPVCLIDTKWKRLDPAKPHHGVSQADMYQMYAYGKEHGAAVVVALYPRTGELGPQVAVYRHQPGGVPAPRIVIATVDIGAALLRDDGNTLGVRQQLVQAVHGWATPDRVRRAISTAA